MTATVCPNTGDAASYSTDPNGMARAEVAQPWALDPRPGHGPPRHAPAPDAKAWTGPWGTEWIGKTSDEDGFYSNIRIPFYKSVRITAQVPQGANDYNVYSIFRGMDGVPLTVGGFTMPYGAKLELQRRTGNYGSFRFIPIVDVPSGSGAIFAHTLAVQGHPQFYYLEGCFHMFSPRHQKFPGLVLSTGAEDYYDSSFYFHSGAFQLPSSGVTHMCSPAGVYPHPPCASGSPTGMSEFSAYRFHDKDPLFFENGTKLQMRNGDQGLPIHGSGLPKGYTGKCYNRDMKIPQPGVFPDPGEAYVQSIAWVYRWD
eukprot:g5861.t1